MNVECTLEMLQPELWLVVSMRKRSESFKSFSADTRFDFCVSLSVHWFVCLFVWAFFFKILLLIFCNSHSWRSLEISPRLPDQSLLDVFLFTLVSASVVRN